jgi:hypothetical protein
MSRYDRSARSASGRTGLYDEITSKIISELEAGRVPWVQPWGTVAAKAPLALPKNAATGRAYSGVNVLILWGAVIEHGFPSQSWLTFRQALSLGGNVRKGEHGTTVVYADRFVPDDEKRRAREAGEEAQAVPFLKRFTVFNSAQCENLPDDIAVAAPAPDPGLIEPQVEFACEAAGVDRPAAFEMSEKEPAAAAKTARAASTEGAVGNGAAGLAARPGRSACARGWAGHGRRRREDANSGFSSRLSASGGRGSAAGRPRSSRTSRRGDQAPSQQGRAGL